MNLFQKHQKTSGYNTIPDGIAEVETAAVPVGSTLLPPTMTMTTMSKTRIVLVAGMTMMLVAGGGTLWMRETTDDGLTTTAVERNRSTGKQCCKKKSPNHCEYTGYVIGKHCKATNGYTGECYRGMGTSNDDCCDENDRGTFYLFKPWSERCS